MTQNSGAQWAPDPTGRHELRFWDGRDWTSNVMDDYVPGQDPMTTPPLPAASSQGPAPGPLLPWWGHLMVGLATCGLWFVVAPAVYWFRRGAVKPALIWSAVWAVLITFGALNGGSDDQVATVAATSSITSTTSTTTTTTTTTTGPVATTTAPPPSPRALVAAAVTSPASTTSAAARKTTTTVHRTTTKTKRTTTTTRTKAKRTTTTTKPPSGGGTDRDYGTCAKAKAAGKGPYYAGIDIEYSWYKDADHDGIVCE